MLKEAEEVLSDVFKVRQYKTIVLFWPAADIYIKL